MLLDWSKCPAVESVPGKVSGSWVFRGTRMPVAAVFENLEDGLSIDEIVQLYDGLTREQIKAVLDFAAHSLETHPVSRSCSFCSTRERLWEFDVRFQITLCEPRRSKAGVLCLTENSCALRRKPDLKYCSPPTQICDTSRTCKGENWQL